MQAVSTPSPDLIRDAAPRALAQPAAERLIAVDWMRGFVMVLMTIDHASVFYNTGRLSDDSAGMWHAGSALPLAQFLTRWITHLCAPTFLFLAGVSIALSTARRQARGEPESSSDRDLLIRGTLIAALDLTYLSLLAGGHLMQVLYAIGVSMIAMVGVRRLSDGMIAALALGWFAFGELLTGALWHPPANSSVPAALTIAHSMTETTWILYPFVPWLCIMSLGFVFARRVLLVPERSAHAARLLVQLGLASLLLFLLVRGLNGYGNMFLLREDGSLAHWLHASKYPPSLAYASLELGIMALCLAGFFALGRRLQQAGPSNPLLVFGQTALFYYLMHFTLLGGSKQLLHFESGGLPRVYVIALITCVSLYPACLLFRRYKQTHPKSWVRFI